MAKKIKLAILRARHDTSLPFISEQACISMLMNNATNHSLLNYWSFNTYGHLDFLGSALFPWVDVNIMASDVSRGTQVKRAYDATKAIANNNVDDFDAYFVITYPGRMTIPNPKAGQPGEPDKIVLDFDGGAGPVANGKPACAIPVMTADHTFMCHELGHVLNFKHTYGVLNNGIDWDRKPPFDEGQVYGDPYDIMSSATFGTRNLDPKKTKYSGSPIFAGPSHPGWPIQPKINMGPAPARAHLHLLEPAAIPASRIRTIQTPGGGSTQHFRLFAASSKGSPHLIIVKAINEDLQGRNRCYIEYRDNKGWDAGLDTFGKDLARRAVVVHTLSDTPTDGVSCWYRGRIIVPVEIDSDLQVIGTPLVVRVTGNDVDAGYVDVEISTMSVRGLDLNITTNHEVITMIDTHEMTTPCGDRVMYGSIVTLSVYSYLPIAYGYGGEGAPDAAQPKVTWKVGNTIIVGSDASLNVMTSDGEFTVQYIVHPVTQELTLVSRGGERYRAAVEVTITEPNGNNPTTVAAIFDPIGWYNGYRPEDSAKLARCLNKYLRYVKLRPRDILIPPGPDPYRQQWRDRINQARLQEVVRLISNSHPAEAIALGALVVMRYGNNILSQETKSKSDISKTVKTIAAVAAICISFVVLASVIKNKRFSSR